MNNIKIALVGCGGTAKNYRHIYTEIPGAELAMIIDANEKVAREVAETLRVKRWSTRFEDCLTPDIDIVDISTPNHLHHEQAIAALQADKHILMQKPLASNVEQAEDIVRLAKETGKTAGMYMFLFDNPLFYDIKDMVGKGMFGEISGLHCRVAHKGGLGMKEGNWRQSREKTGGGAFIQLAVHNMNMLKWLIDSHITGVMAYSKNLLCPNVGGDDLTAAVCEFDSGALGTVTAAYCAGGDELSLYGTKGSIFIDDFKYVTLTLSEPWHGSSITYNTPGERKMIEMPYWSRSLFDAKNPYDQHVAFIKAVQNSDPAPIPLQVGLDDMKIVRAVYESAQTGKSVSV